MKVPWLNIIWRENGSVPGNRRLRSMKSVISPGTPRSTSQDCRLCECGASSAWPTSQRRTSACSPGPCQAAMASGGSALLQPVKALAAAIAPPPARWMKRRRSILGSSQRW
ncbi:hypothetical protein D9M68_947410 [compost metagenome]